MATRPISAGARGTRVDWRAAMKRSLRRAAEALLKTDWSHAYSREAAAFPVASLRRNKYWAPVGRVDNVYGDRNLFCSCLPVGEAGAAGEVAD